MGRTPSITFLDQSALIVSHIAATIDVRVAAPIGRTDIRAGRLKEHRFVPELLVAALAEVALRILPSGRKRKHIGGLWGRSAGRCLLLRYRDDQSQEQDNESYVKTYAHGQTSIAPSSQFPMGSGRTPFTERMAMTP